ncbi:MAG: DUF6677 family protein [Planctomycetota bacterium]
MSQTTPDIPPADTPPPPTDSAEPSSEKPPPVWNLPAAVAAWLVPGMGHILSGHVRRGVILMVCITGLWAAGLLVGGISVISARDANGALRAWYLGQAMIAPSFVVEYTHDRLRARSEGRDPSPFDESIPFSPAYGRAAEIGTLYCTLAGMLNLLAIIDIAYREPRSTEHALPLGAGEETKVT